MTENIGELYIAGAQIEADTSVVRSDDGKVYPAGEFSGVFIGNARETLREGFRVMARNGEVYEDDA